MIGRGRVSAVVLAVMAALIAAAATPSDARTSSRGGPRDASGGSGSAQSEQTIDLHGLGRHVPFVVGPVRDPHEACGIFEGQRTDEYAVQHAEYSGTRGDAQSDDQDGEDCEPEIAP